MGEARVLRGHGWMDGGVAGAARKADGPFLGWALREVRRGSKLLACWPTTRATGRRRLRNGQVDAVPELDFFSHFVIGGEQENWFYCDSMSPAVLC